MNKQYYLFDLDGTLTDPKIGITKALDYALTYMGIITENLDDLTKYIGPSLKKSLNKDYNLSREDVDKAIVKYREYFSETGIYENNIYEGIPELLDKLKKLGKTIILATAKPTPYAIEILKHFELYKYFTFVAGSEFDGTRSEKVDVITYALEQCKITDLDNAVMIGDREHDILGAKYNKISSVGVLFGYGSKEELENAKADVIVDTVEKLEELLLDNN